MRFACTNKQGASFYLRQHNPHTTWRRFGGRYMTLPVNRGTLFRYGPEFRLTLEDSGTGFRYLDLAG
jgi:hypothetical protein